MDEEKIKGMINAIVEGAKDLATGEFKDLGKEIQSDTKEFLEASKEKLNEWTDKLSAGDLAENEFRYLVKNQANLLKMKTLTASGKAAIAIDNIRQGILDVVTKVVLAAIK